MIDEVKALVRFLCIMGLIAFIGILALSMYAAKHQPLMAVISDR